MGISAVMLPVFPAAAVIAALAVAYIAWREILELLVGVVGLFMRLVSLVARVAAKLIARGVRLGWRHGRRLVRELRARRARREVEAAPVPEAASPAIDDEELAALRQAMQRKDWMSRLGEKSAASEVE